MILITKDWLKARKACTEGYEWSLKTLAGGSMAADLFLEALIKDKKYDLANWILERVFTRTQAIQYAIFSAEQVIGIYEARYPGDDKPRKAIEAAKTVLKNDTPINRKACGEAAWAAWAAWVVEDAEADREKMQKKIISYGIELFRTSK